MTENTLYPRVIGQLVRDGTLSKRDTVLVIAGGVLDREVLLAHEFHDVTISNVDDKIGGEALAPFAWDYQDAESLSYADELFDIVLVHAGLHHCRSPHRALLEMYRVARKAIIVFEARDSLAMKLAKHFGFTPDYEVEAVSAQNFQTGGVGNGPIPNFVYRWTENEVTKTIKSFEPRYVPKIRYFYGLLLPHVRFRHTSRPVLRLLLRIMAPAAELFAKMFPKQGNEFAFMIFKGGKLQPWLVENEGEIVTSKAAVSAMGRAIRSVP